MSVPPGEGDKGTVEVPGGAWGSVLSLPKLLLELLKLRSSFNLSVSPSLLLSVSACLPVSLSLSLSLSSQPLLCTHLPRCWKVSAVCGMDSSTAQRVLRPEGEGRNF